MYKMSAADRRQRLMKRVHTLQSEDQQTSTRGSSLELDSHRSSFHSEDEGEKQIDTSKLFVPDIKALGLDRGETPPHKRDMIEKIPMRARSQSWLIRTRHLLHEERV
uniref:Uncharacterized protein n=1 Tax=Heterorhabditis bacteriophora TaxID=37862 RepID=A0A1I7WPL2_HETBA